MVVGDVCRSRVRLASRRRHVHRRRRRHAPVFVFCDLVIDHAIRGTRGPIRTAVPDRPQSRWGSERGGAEGPPVIWAAAYVLLLLVLFVRVQTAPDAAPRAPVHAQPADPLWLIRLHHRLFAVIVLGGPVEALLRSGPSRWRPVGLLCFAAGVALYRLGGRALGDALSPLSEPRPGVPLVTTGPYRWVRHPMYLGQALIAVGAPLTLGCRVTPWLALPAIVVLAMRIAHEESALARTYPEYPHYAAQAKRIFPFLF